MARGTDWFASQLYGQKDTVKRTFLSSSSGYGAFVDVFVLTGIVIALRARCIGWLV
jgi:hypothetical protein